MVVIEGLLSFVMFLLSWFLPGLFLVILLDFKIDYTGLILSFGISISLMPILAILWHIFFKEYNFMIFTLLISIVLLTLVTLRKKVQK